MVKTVSYDLGPWVMAAASVCILFLIHGYSPPDSTKVQISEPVIVATANNTIAPEETSEVCLAENESDWMFFDKTVFTLKHRFEHDGEIQYEVRYSGSDLFADLLYFESQLIAHHEGSNITILVQSNTDAELITHICEQGKVIHIE